MVSVALAVVVAVVAVVGVAVVVALAVVVADVVMVVVALAVVDAVTVAVVFGVMVSVAVAVVVTVTVVVSEMNENNSLEPGPELDKLIAEKVMGTSQVLVDFVQVVDQVKKSISIGTELRYPPYSTNIASAWEIVEKLKWAEPELSWNDEQHCWFASFHKGSRSGIAETSEDAPHAICLAALKAI